MVEAADRLQKPDAEPLDRRRLPHPARRRRTSGAAGWRRSRSASGSPSAPRARAWRSTSAPARRTASTARTGTASPPSAAGCWGPSRRLVQRPRGRGARPSTCELSKDGRAVTIEDLEKGALGAVGLEGPAADHQRPPLRGGRHAGVPGDVRGRVLRCAEADGALHPAAQGPLGLRRGAGALSRPRRPPRDHRERPPRPDRLRRAQLRALHRGVRPDAGRGRADAGARKALRFRLSAAARRQASPTGMSPERRCGSDTVARGCGS